MKKSLIALTMVTALAAGSAQAGGFHLSVIAAPPVPYYYAPAPVYAPVYAPAPVVAYYAPMPVYYGPQHYAHPPRGHHHWHEQHLAMQEPYHPYWR